MLSRIFDDDDEDKPIEYLPAPVHQDTVFIIMYQSHRSGGTYTELRKSVQGKNRFLSALRFMGYNMDLVQVIEQKKVWVPEKKNKKLNLRSERTKR